MQDYWASHLVTPSVGCFFDLFALDRFGSWGFWFRSALPTLGIILLAVTRNSLAQCQLWKALNACSKSGPPRKSSPGDRNNRKGPKRVTNSGSPVVNLKARPVRNSGIKQKTSWPVNITRRSSKCPEPCSWQGHTCLQFWSPLSVRPRVWSESKYCLKQTKQKQVPDEVACPRGSKARLNCPFSPTRECGLRSVWNFLNTIKVR